MNPRMTLEMENGRDIVIELLPEAAPNTVSSLIYAASRGWLDHHAIQRIVPGSWIDLSYTAFNHRLGHFIGLKEHEFGDVSSASDWEAQPGMIFSIEPGIYLAGETGVRIEDLVLVTEDGVEKLNHYPHELDVIA